MTCFLSALLVFLSVLSGCGNNGGGETVLFGGNAARVDNDIIQPYLRARSYGTLEEAGRLDMAGMDALNLGLTAYNLLVDYENTKDERYLETAKEFLDYLMFSYPSTYSNDNLFVWRYNFPWGDLAPGWWSCMDSAINALAFQAGAQIFGDPAYETMYRKAANGLLLSVQEGGSALWQGTESFWMSEYAWEGLSLENESYVLNGKTFALLALRILAAVTEDPRYLTMYRYALNGYRSLCDRYYFPDGIWTRYMLNPEDIEPMHYAIFDAILLESLHKISGDSFFADELSKRRNIFRDQYPFYINYDNNYLFSMMGPPWPYWIDTYVIRVDFIVNNVVVDQKTSIGGYRYDIPPKDRFFLTGSIPSGTSRVIVWSVHNGQSFRLYETSIAEAKRGVPRNPVSVDFTISCAYDAVCVDNNTLEIDPSIGNVGGSGDYTDTQGRIIMTLGEPVSRSDVKYLGLNIHPEALVISLEVMLIDVDGKSTSQYYIPLKGEDDNFILVNWIGFDRITELNDLIKEVQLKIHTDDEDPYSIRINDIVVFDNDWSIKKYFDDVSLYFPEKDKIF